MGREAARKLIARVRADLEKGVAPAKVNATHKLDAADLMKPAEALTAYGRESGLRGDVKEWAFGAEEGAVSDVVQFGRGLLAIFQLARKTDDSTRDFEDVQADIREHLQSQKWNRQMSLLVRRLFQEAEIRPPKLGAWLIQPRGNVPISGEVLRMLLDK